MNSFDQILSVSKSALITAHIHPDPDAVASALAMHDLLRSKYPACKTEIYLTGEKTNMWDFLKDADQINWVSSIAEHFDSFDTLILLDGNSWDRFVPDATDSLDLSAHKTICIDHHPAVADSFDLNLSDPTAASTTQIIYKLFFRDNLNLIDEDTASTLMVGIMGDTATFRYVKPTNADILMYAKELIEFGNIDVQSLELH